MAEQVWRVSTYLRVGAPLVFAVMTAGLWVVRGPRAGLIVLVVTGLYAWLGILRPAIILTADEVIVRNPFRTVRVPLSEVTDVDCAYAGLAIRMRSGASVTAWAVQKANYQKWLKRESRADRVAAAIAAAA